MKYEIPKTQRAVQLTAADQLKLNTCKEVVRPGPYQILCRVEATGLCFSDLKLLKQFSGHVRKSEVVSGIEPEILKEITSYVPGNAPTVPGHEAIVQIWAVGDKVENFKPGERYLVQADFRWIRTAKSNGAFGYNFEGALQEYVLLDRRVIISPDGESMLIRVTGDNLSAAAIALVEPWGCVEQAYAVKERTRVKTTGKMLVVAEREIEQDVFSDFLNGYGRPSQITWVSKNKQPLKVDVEVVIAAGVSELSDACYDDVIYFGSNAEMVEELFVKINTGGLLNVVLCGGRLGREVACAIGRVHYGNIRITGTAGCDPAESMRHIPESGEIRKGDKINIIGAGGPMGVMHVIRDICDGVEGVSVFAGDLDEQRLTALTKMAEPLARKNNVVYRAYNPAKDKIAEAFDYVVLMAPVPRLAADAIRNCAKDGIINIFAGIPADVAGEIDLDAYIEKQLYFIGTSGSTLEDMKRVLAKVEAGRLDTNLSVAAVCGLEGAVQGIRAVEKRLVPGKIIVYPSCKGLGLVRLEQLSGQFEQVAKCLSDGAWNARAEKALLDMY